MTDSRKREFFALMRSNQGKDNFFALIRSDQKIECYEFNEPDQRGVISR